MTTESGLEHLPGSECDAEPSKATLEVSVSVISSNVLNDHYLFRMLRMLRC